MVNSIPHPPPTPCRHKRTQGVNVPFTASSVHIVEGQLFPLDGRTAQMPTFEQGNYMLSVQILHRYLCNIALCR